jgi:cell wall-associated NlpC family hydrolase
MRLFFNLFLILQSYLFFAQNTHDLKRDSLVEFAKKQLGVPYRYGTAIPGKSFDCSGFTNYVYTSFGIASPRVSSGFLQFGTLIPIQECQKGDCIIFTGTNITNRSAGHVGIVIENKDGNIEFIHCSSSSKHNGVVITNLQSSNYRLRFLQARRIL